MENLILLDSTWVDLYSEYRDGNRYMKPEIRLVFTPLKYGFGSTFRPVDLLMGTKFYSLGLWVRVCSYKTQTRKPMDFLNPTQPSVIVILFYKFIINLTSHLLPFLFWWTLNILVAGRLLLLYNYSVYMHMVVS